MSIPILDCASVGLNASEAAVDDDALKTFGAEFVSTLEAHGVCYVKNYGITESKFDGYKAASRKFFSLPTTEKASLKMKPGQILGWISHEQKALNFTERPPDLYEAVNYSPGDQDEYNWPDEGFRVHTRGMFEVFHRLAQRLCYSLSLGLGLDKAFMANAHKSVGSENGFIHLRTNYYPPIDDRSAVKPGQIRFVEHCDHGTFTLLHQDDIGGLEIELPGGGFVPVLPIPGTLVVLVGELLQRWTSDALVAPRHRVVIPETDIKLRDPRQSIVLFIYPDGDCEVKPLDGSDKYKPVTGMGYFQDLTKARTIKY